jgi:hypothetical protein
MLRLNFYKIRTTMDIRLMKQGGDAESEARYNQILQTIGQKAELDYICNDILSVIEKSPADLGGFVGKQKTIYIMIVGLDKERSSWTGSDIKTTLGNMALTKQTKDANPDAEPWIGGLNNNISAEKALFDLRTVKKT